MIWEAHRPITTTAARLLQRVGGARKTQSVRVERLRAIDSLGLALNTAETPDCDSAPGDSEGDADDCGDVHLGARFQDGGATRSLATGGKWLGFVAVDSVDGAQAIGGSFAVHVPVIAAHNVSSKLGGEPGVVAGLCEAAHSGPRLVGGGALGFAHEYLGELNLDGRRDAARNPVANTLHSTPLFVEAKKLRQLGWPTEIFDKRFVIHGAIKHHVYLCVNAMLSTKC